MGEILTLQQRMQLLNLEQVGGVRQRPPPPSAVGSLVRSHSSCNEVDQQAEGHISSIGNQPAAGLPEPPRRPERKKPPPPVIPRRDSTPVPPALPSRGQRRASELSLTRRASQESVASTHSATSAVSTLSSRTAATTASRTPSFDGRNSQTFTVRAPEYDPASLPKLPPKGTQQQQQQQHPKRPSISISKSTAPVPPPSTQPPAVQVPPPLPSRRASATPKVPATATPHERSNPSEQRPNSARVVQTPRRLDPRSLGLNKATEEIPAVPQKPSPVISNDAPPPPIPASSRPNLASLQASKPKSKTYATTTTPNTQINCLKCRDFSGPDGHAARFPRKSIPTTDIGWLSHQLTDPFSSLTDKARAIFMWLHFNIAYNCDAFFSGNIQPSTPASTISSGLAVCEGYAALFTAFATHIGMESVVIGGHGKGFGYKPLQPGQAVPPFDAGHAWNAVRIDNGEWKLIDACWGAGHLGGEDNRYHQELSSEFFTMDNDEFGLRHFPKDRNLFFRTDGRTMTWEEYIVGQGGPGELLQLYKGVVGQHGFSQTSFIPAKKHIRVVGVSPKSRVQFQFSKVCEHWDGERAGVGKPFVYVLDVGGKDGRKRTVLPFQTNGTHWWLDVAAEDLGCQGQTVSLYSVETVDGKNGRGMTVDFVATWIGRRAMSFGGVAAWQLV